MSSDFHLLWYLQKWKKLEPVYEHVTMQILNPVCLSVFIYRSSIGSATTWRWSSSSPPKPRRGEEVKRSGRTSFHSPRVWFFAFRLVPTPPLWWPFCSIHIASLQMAQEKLAPCTVLLNKGKQEELLGVQQRRRCYSFYSFMLNVQLFECQRAPVCFGPHLNV